MTLLSGFMETPPFALAWFHREVPPIQICQLMVVPTKLPTKFPTKFPKKEMRINPQNVQTSVAGRDAGAPG